MHRIWPLLNIRRSNNDRLKKVLRIDVKQKKRAMAAISRIKKFGINDEIPDHLEDDALWDRILANATDEEKGGYKFFNRPPLH